MFRNALAKLALLGGAALMPSMAFAQDAAPVDESGGEIVVTALRNDTPLQKTPAAVVAISGADLATRGISNVENLAAVVPAVSFGKTFGQVHIAVRGIGADANVAGQDPRIAFYLDNVYIARPDAQLTGLFDVESVQVLKGPQGTLYGRNATGGAVVVTSARPTDDLSGYFRVGYGSYNDITSEAAISGPIADTLSVRFAARYENRDGYGKNLVTGRGVDDKNEYNLRASVLWKATPNLKFLTIADYSKEDDSGNSLHYLGQAQAGTTARGLLLGGTTVVNGRDISSDIDPKVNIRTWGLVEYISYEAGFATIKSTTAYRKTDTTNLVDVDGTSLQLNRYTLFDHAKQFSEEVTANGNAGRLSWLLGGQYFHENIDPAGSELPLSAAVRGGPISPLTQGFYQSGHLRSNAFAAYGNLAYNITDNLKVSVGGRYSTEDKKLDDVFQLDFSRPYVPGAAIIPQAGFPRSQDTRWSKFTPTGTIEYQATSNIFAYATIGQGFKSGGYNIGVAGSPFAPESITSYEGGIKTTWFNRRLIANAIGFHYNYTNLQVTQVVGTVSVTQNAASAKVDGAEFELAIKPVRNMSLGGNLAYVDARYVQFQTADPSNIAGGVRNLAGYRLAQAPKVSFGLYGDYKIDLGRANLTLRGDYNYVGRQYFTPFQN